MALPKEVHWFAVRTQSFCLSVCPAVVRGYVFGFVRSASACGLPQQKVNLNEETYWETTGVIRFLLCFRAGDWVWLCALCGWAGRVSGACGWACATAETCAACGWACATAETCGVRTWLSLRNSNRQPTVAGLAHRQKHAARKSEIVGNVRGVQQQKRNLNGETCCSKTALFFVCVAAGLRRLHGRPDQTHIPGLTA